MKNPQVNIRLSEDIVADIEKLIEAGEFDSTSEFVRYAIRKTLKSFKSRTPPPTS